MNNERRQRINRVSTDLSKYQGELQALFVKISEAITDYNDKLEEIRDNITGEVEGIRDDEQEAFDGMPEGLQASERGEKATEAINNLESAISELESLEALEELQEKELDECLGYLEEAAT